MKRPTSNGPKPMSQRIKGLIPTRLVKTGQESLTRISADMGKKEYQVFVEPIKRRLWGRFNVGAKLASMPGPPLRDPLPTVEGVDESSLVEEIFVRPALAFDAPNEELAESNENLQDAVPGIGREDDPSDTDSEAAATSENTRVQANNAPRVRTMVEAISDLPAGEGGLSKFLSEDLQDIFKSVDYTNPRTKALVRSREHVDVYELAKELDEYARSIGAVPPTR